MRLVLPVGVVAFAAALVLPSAAAVRTNVAERSYDRFGRLVGLSVDGERRTEIAYDEATGRVASMRVAGADEPFRWEYEPGSDLKKSLRYPNGAKVTWEYEPRRDFVTLVSNDVYSTFRYAYDAGGRRVAKNDERYEYNARGELTLATNAVTGAEFAYRYDDIGNRLWSRELGTNCVYAANELNQYTNVVRGGVSERSVFDIDGNQTNIVTSTGEWSVEYNGENRPVRWTRTSDGVTVLMSYDHMGRLVRKNGETFVYDGYLNVSKTVWDPTEPVATRPLVWRGEDGVACFYTHDANKNVSDVVWTMSGETAAHYDYAPFGALRSMAGVCAADNPLRFSSEFADDTLGLTYYNHRHYWPAMGRWIQRDALLGHLQEPGLYLFCQNQVAWVTDYLGLDVIKTNSDGSCPTKCYNGRNVQLEAIWLCTRKLGGVGPTAVPLLNHQYVCCGGVNSECYGVQKFRPSCMKGCDRIKDPKTRKLCKETCYARKGSIIEKEVSATGTCEKRCVSPSEKDSACSGSAKMPEDYAIGPFGVDCQEWADDATSSKCE